MDASCMDLIPATDVIRRRLARNVKERKILRGLLDLSLRASRVDDVPIGMATPGAKPDGDAGRVRG